MELSGRFAFTPENQLAAEALADKKFVEVPILHVGTFEHRKFGKFNITEEHLNGMVASFEANGGANNPPECDFEHIDNAQTRPPDSRKSGEIFGLSVRNMEFERFSGPTLVALTCFTDAGRQLVASGEITRVSADFDLNHKFEGVGEPVPFLFKFTLTNSPFLKTLPSVKLSDGDKPEPIIYTGDQMQTKITYKGKEIVLDEKQFANKEELLKELIATAGLPEDADFDMLVAFIQALKGGAEPAPEPGLESDNPEPDVAVMSDDPADNDPTDVADDSKSKELKLSLAKSEDRNKQLEGRIKMLEDKNTTDAKKAFDTQRAFMLKDATDKGRITLEQAEHYKALFTHERGNKLEELANILGGHVPQFAVDIPRVLVGNDDNAVNEIQFTDTDAAVAKEKGISNVEALTARLEG